MQPLLTSAQIHEADKFTIENEPIPSLNLMERASSAFVEAFTAFYSDASKSISVYCGTGNNGGDGLAIARLLTAKGYKVAVKIARLSEKASKEFEANLEKIKKTNVPYPEYKQAGDFPLETADLIIDALLGNGLNKPLAGDYKSLVESINSYGKTIVAVDVPTGFFSEGDVNKDAVVVQSDLTITFQQPKINFLLPESRHAIKKWIAVDIGINKNFTDSLNSAYQFVEARDIIEILKPRENFSNKGTYGHALIVAGQPKTMGAALLCSSACAHAGAGLTTACVPESGLTALNSYQPEVMAIIREGDKLPDTEWEKFTAISIGPGLGKIEDSLKLLKKILTNYKNPVVIDADALNMLAENQELLQQLPKHSILTPHMKEFDRLFGEHTTWWQRLRTASIKAKDLDIYIVLKNDYTITASPDGKLYFNPTSNAAMASGGMGDALTGIITALLAQKYPPLAACLAGIYVHGKAGDDLALPDKMMVVLPGELIKQVPKTMAALLK